jgi:creatinine amidohydrolase
MAFAGTLSLKADTAVRLWSDIVESVRAAGVRKLVLFNTHGGNASLMDVAARDWRARLEMLVYSVSWFNLPLVTPDGQDVLARFAPTEQRFGVHAGQMETALMLALKPQLVRQDKLRHFESSAQVRARAFPILGNGKSAKLAWAAQDLNPQGAAGDATQANAQDGQDLLEATGRALAKLLEEIDCLPPDTLRGIEAA